MAIEQARLACILVASLLVAGRPLNLKQLEALFEHEAADRPTPEQLREALLLLADRLEQRGIELVEVASGYRMQARAEYNPWISNLFQEKAPRYSRALLETLVLIAYRQPITRGEIEDVRGVAVSSNIIKTLMEREWIRELGHRDVPGRPALLGTTRQFLDYFNLKRIDELPTLSEIKDLDQIDPNLAREMALLEQTATDTDAGLADKDGSDEEDHSGEAAPLHELPTGTGSSGTNEAARPPTQVHGLIRADGHVALHVDLGDSLPAEESRWDDTLPAEHGDNERESVVESEKASG